MNDNEQQNKLHELEVAYLDQEHELTQFNELDPDMIYRRLGGETQVNDELRGLVHIDQDIMGVLAQSHSDIEKTINDILREWLEI